MPSSPRKFEKAREKFRKIEFYSKVVLSPTKKSGINWGTRIRLKNWKIPSSSWSNFEKAREKFRKIEFYSKVVLSSTKKPSINWGIRISVKSQNIPPPSLILLVFYFLIWDRTESKVSLVIVVMIIVIVCECICFDRETHYPALRPSPCKARYCFQKKIHTESSLQARAPAIKIKYRSHIIDFRKKFILSLACKLELQQLRSSIVRISVILGKNSYWV